MLSRSLVFFLLIGLFALFPAASTVVAAPQKAKAFIQELGDEAVSNLVGQDMSDSEREAAFRRLFMKGFDIKLISRFVLGRYWRQASAEQRDEYQNLFKAFIVRAYASRLGEYSGEPLMVKDSRAEGDKDTMVYTVVNRPNGGDPIRIDWRVRADDNGGFKIIDVVIEGISMAITHRSEFASVIRSNGGKVEGLLNALRQQTASK